jgi:hypothetical protein
MLAAMKAAIPLPAEIKAAEQPTAPSRGVPAPAATRALPPGKAGIGGDGISVAHHAGAAPPSGIKPGVSLSVPAMPTQPRPVSARVEAKSPHALEAYRNIHAGKRGFIMATGPSVARQHIGWLKDEIVVGINFAHKITLHVTHRNPVAWIPTYMTTADDRVLNNLADEWAALDTKVVLTDTCMLRAKYNHPNCISGTGVSILYRPNKFIWDCTVPIQVHRASSTVGHVALPFALFLGLNPIYLIGCDCTPLGHAYEDHGVMCRHAAAIWKSAFNPAMAVARKCAEAKGIRIYNATLGGNLTTLERVDLDSLRSAPC